LIEVLGLVIIVILAQLFHFTTILVKYSDTNRNFKLYFIYLYFIYFCLQSNFSITSHNFGFQNESNLFIKTYYCLMIFIFLLQFFTWLKNEIMVSLHSISNTILRDLKLKYFIYSFFAILSLSLVPLITDLLWKLLSINFINFNTNYYTLVTTFVILILIRFSANFKLIYIDLALIIIWAVTSYILFYLAIPSLIRFTISTFYYLHTTILVSVILSLTSNLYYHTDWAHSPTKLNTTYLSSANSYINTLYLHYPSLEEVSTSISHKSNISTISVNTSPETPMFNLVISNLGIWQEFLSDGGRLMFLSTTIDNFTVYLLILFLFIFIFTSTQIIKNYIIKC
jgi:hypothetical protein